MTAIGDLRERVTLQQKATVTDAIGGETVTWSDVVTLWALVEPLAGLEKYEAEAVQSQLSLRVTIRYRDDVDATWRVRWRSRTLEIHSVENRDLQRVYLTLDCAVVN